MGASGAPELAEEEVDFGGYSVEFEHFLDGGWLCDVDTGVRGEVVYTRQVAEKRRRDVDSESQMPNDRKEGR